MMHPTQQKEQFSLAFIRAVTSVAGFAMSRPEVDDDSCDLTIRGTRRDGPLQQSPVLEVQVKCTQTDRGRSDAVSYPLKRKNYDDLRAAHPHVPSILVVVCVPAETHAWLQESAEAIALRGRAYWLSLRGAPPAETDRTRAVHLPRAQRFTVEALRAMMKRIGQGGLP